MRWNTRAKVERPEYPKMVPISVTGDAAKDLLSSLLLSDPHAEIVDGGGRGLYVRIHNQAAEAAAKLLAESRRFPLASARPRVEATSEVEQREPASE
jgi:hypothetical protein